jgi:hypothetical protein
MSTRQLAPALRNSIRVKATRDAVRASAVVVRFLKTQNVAMVSAISAIADGKREEPSVTPPRTADTAATHQWKNGGLYAISPLLLRGNTQLPVSSIL